MIHFIDRLKHLIIVLLFLSYSVATSAQHFSNLIVFGDSLSDIGNSTWDKVPGRGAKYLYGAPITNLDPDKLVPLLWVQYLAARHQFTETTVLPSQHWRGQSLLTTNMDYAWASAETGDRYLNDQQRPFAYADQCHKMGLINSQLSCVPGVIVQVKQFLLAVHNHHQQPGKQTLFIIWAGGNDIFDTLMRVIYRIDQRHQQPSLLLPSSRYALAWSPAGNIYTAVKLLVKAGVPANHIMVLNLPNLAQVPDTIHLIKSAFPASQRSQRWALKIMSGWTQLFNVDLKFRLTYGFYGRLKPQLVDINKDFTRMVTEV